MSAAVVGFLRLFRPVTLIVTVPIFPPVSGVGSTVGAASGVGVVSGVIDAVGDAEGTGVTSAVFALTPGNSEEIKAKMKELQGKRSASQPLDMPSAGSAFKRPVGGYAAALIDQTGLKGFQVGGAAVSEKHAGFVVNLGGATAADVLSLLEQVSDKVFAFSGIRLEPEIRLWKP